MVQAGGVSQETMSDRYKVRTETTGQSAHTAMGMERERPWRWPGPPRSRELLGASLEPVCEVETSRVGLHAAGIPDT